MVRRPSLCAFVVVCVLAVVVAGLALTPVSMAQVNTSTLIGRVTELLRDVSATRGRVLANDFARTLAHDRWQSIILGLAGVLVGLVAALFVVRRTVGPLKAIARAIRSLAGGEKHTSIPATDIHNEIGDIARASEPVDVIGRCEDMVMHREELALDEF